MSGQRDAASISMVHRDIQKLVETIKTVTNVTLDCVSENLETLTDPQRKELIGAATDYAEMKRELDDNMHVLKDIENKVKTQQAGALPGGVIGYAKTRLQNRKDQWTEEQIEEDADLKAMREELGEEATGGAAADDSDDDDVVTMQVEESFVCPITTKTLEDPVRSTKCKHYYEKNAIFAILKKHHAGNPFTCPNIGCNQTISKGDLKDAMDITRKIARVAKKKRLEATQAGPADDGFTQID